MRHEALHADLDEGDPVFVTNGFTYGGGVEKNFGWLGAFVQVKAINYGNVNLSNSNVGTQIKSTLPVFLSGVLLRQTAEDPEPRFPPMLLL